MIDLQGLPLLASVAVFLTAAAAIAAAGTSMTAVADRFADRTGLGEALVGTVLLGASTSLSGSVTSISAALNGHAELAAMNAVGGIAVQTLFLAIGDIVYRRANLEHAAASSENLIFGIVLIALLSLPLIATAVPWHGPWIHPVSLVLVAGYLFGLRLGDSARRRPMWRPRRTRETKSDTPDEPKDRPAAASLALRFALLAVILVASGLAIEATASRIVAETALSEGFVGAFLTSTATSLPELVTTIVAIRRGALTLAVAGIVGGNTFDVLFLSASDMAFTEGSIYAALGPDFRFLLALTILMTAVLVTGLLRRETHGFANIGFESTTIIGLYAIGAVTLWML